jgi:hypothetical protein
VEIKNCTYVAIKNLTVDSRGLAGVTGISAKDGMTNLTHDILLDGNTLIGQGGSQQTDAISTKTPTWGWTIRRNKVSGAGTGMYLGNSDGTMPFFASVIENNLIQNTIGYNLQIKHQLSRPYIAGMPTAPTSTIIRNNVFIKDDQPSPDGDRPNAMVGGFPDTGYGSTDLYEIYGNFFNHNPREALLQAEGRVSVHDNIFVDGQYAALAFHATESTLKVAYAYNNTIYSTLKGIYFSVLPSVDYAVVGNLIFAATPIGGFISNFANNITDTVANAVNYVNAPSFLLGSMDFYPRSTKVEGASLDLAKFAPNQDYKLDFNGIPKDFATNTMVFRGAYAGLGVNPGWKLEAAVKPSDQTAVKATPVPSSITCSPATIVSTGTASCTVTLSTAAGAGGLSVMLISSSVALPLPGSVFVGAGSNTQTFTAKAGVVATTVTVVVTATANGVSASTKVTASPAPAALAGISCFPSSIASGASTTCKITLNAIAPVSTAVTISTSSAVLTAPASLTIAAGAASGSAIAKAGTASANQSVTVSATLAGVVKRTTVNVLASSTGTTAKFLLKGNSSELSGLMNGSTVAPAVGSTGKLMVRGSGSVNFSPFLNGDGVYFEQGGNQNSNAAFYDFTGSPVGSIFNANGGQISFSVQSSYSWAERKALPSPAHRWVFDVFDASRRVFEFIVVPASGRLVFYYQTASMNAFFYYVPVGQEDALFGKGIVLNVRLAWDGSHASLYLNRQLAVAASYTKVTPSWTSASDFSFGAESARIYGGGYFASDDVIADFQVQ